MQRPDAFPIGPALQPGSVVGDYQLGDLLGGGGMGVVFRAVQLKLGRQVALKIINPLLAQQDEVRQRFIREARIGAAVEHPNALPVYEVGSEEGLLFISMRYVDGSDLARIIKREAYLEGPRAVEILRQVASALDAAHAGGLVHRDVKPHNILLAKHGDHEHAYLMDFGLARHLLDTGLTGTGDSLGTPAYMSPEQVLGRTVDARSDVYSLGVVLFQALTGNVPFDAPSTHAVLFAQVHEPVPRASAVNTAVPSAFDAVVARAMAKQANDRFPSAGDLALAAQAALTGSKTPLAERSVATGPAAPPVVHAESSFPARVTDSYITTEAPKMSPDRFVAFLETLRQRNWTEDELQLRVYPHSPPGWEGLAPTAAPAIVTVYERLDAASRTRELLEVLPGGMANGLLPAEIAERMKPRDGERLSKRSVRTVMGNLQRLENRLLDEGRISRRVLGKSFERYDVEGAGRYYLEQIDRDELDAHLADSAHPSVRQRSASGDADSKEQLVEIDRSMRQPVARLHCVTLERTAVAIDGITYRAEVRDGEVRVLGAPLRVTWAQAIGNDLVDISLGAKVPPMLDSIDRARHAEILAGALVTSAVVGHPRREPRGRPVSFVWTDHVALAASGDPSAAMDFSWVRDEQAQHMLDLAGRVELRSLGGTRSDGEPRRGDQPDIAERVVLIRIPRLHRPGMSEDEMYEATRKWWMMNPERHDPDWAFTVVNGKVRAIYRIDDWERDEKSGRWAFRGIQDREMENRYVGLDVTGYLPYGAQNPIRYVNC